MKRLSIIVPMYNVEPYIEKCLSCLADQDIPRDEYEIICINDGSPDNSREIVKRFQKEYKNIFLIDQENQGVSCARNSGIERATGKYLLFIDPDDYVETNCFFRILKIADEHEAQVAFLGFSVLKEDGTIMKNVHNELYVNQIVIGIEAYYMTHILDATDPDRIYGILLSNEFLNRNELRFLPGVPYLEDGELIVRILCLATQCIFVGCSFYWRTIRPGSATNSGLFNSKYASIGFTRAAINLRNFRDKTVLSQVQREFMNQPVVKFTALSIASTGKLLKLRTFFRVYSILKENNFDNLELSGCNNPYKKLGTLYNKSVLLLYAYVIFRPYVLFLRKSIT